jgi:nicotinamide-nucleotide amidase
VPRELEGLIESWLEPWLDERSSEGGIEQHTLRVACVAESRVEELISPAYDEMGRENITVLAKPGEIQIRVSASGPAASRAAVLARGIERLRDLVGDAAYGVGGDNDLETVVGGLLTARGATVATAESCTGGLVSQRLTAVAGSSRYFLGGVVAYSNEAKERLLDIDGQEIEELGAVSREVAVAMARGALGRFGADYGLGVTGVAGPDGGTAAKPVGTVHLAVVHREGSCRHHQGRFPGHRERVRWLSSQWLLDLLRRELLGIEAAS